MLLTIRSNRATCIYLKNTWGARERLNGLWGLWSVCPWDSNLKNPLCPGTMGTWQFVSCRATAMYQFCGCTAWIALTCDTGGLLGACSSLSILESGRNHHPASELESMSIENFNSELWGLLFQSHLCPKRNKILGTEKQIHGVWCRQVSGALRLTQLL